METFAVRWKKKKRREKESVFGVSILIEGRRVFECFVCIKTRTDAHSVAKHGRANSRV